MEKTINQLYFGNYFFQAIFNSFVKWFLPVYFVITAGLSGAEISFIVSLGLLPTIMKPLFGWLIDKVGISGQHRKPYIVLGYLILTCTFIPFGLIELKTYLWLGAGLLFGANSAIALIDTSIDAIALDNNRISSGKTLTLFALGSNLGGFTMMIIYFLTVRENIESGWWFGAYLAIILCGIPLVLNAIRYNDSPNWSLVKAPEVVGTQKSYTVSRKMMVLTVLFMFFANSFALAEFLIEPYLAINFGTRAFSIYTIIVYTAGVGGLPILFYLYKNRDTVIFIKGKLLLIVGLCSTVFLLTLSFGSITVIYIVTGFIVLAGVLQNFGLMGILLAACPDKRRAMWYQLFAFSYALFLLLWSSLGPLLSDIVGTKAVFLLIIGLYLPLLYVLPAIDAEFKKLIGSRNA
jgi:MFS family permease